MRAYALNELCEREETWLNHAFHYGLLITQLYFLLHFPPHLLI